MFFGRSFAQACLQCFRLFRLSVAWSIAWACVQSKCPLPPPLLSVCRSFYALAGRDIPRTGRKGHKFEDVTTEKGVIIFSGRSDWGGGKTRRASGHLSLWTPWQRAPLRGPTGQPQRHPACPPCLVLLPRQGGRRNALILTMLSRDTPEDTGRDPCN